MTNERSLRDAPVWKLLLTMSLPMILVMTVNVLYNMADVFFLGRTGETVQVAAVSLASPVFAAISAFNTLIGFGGCTAISLCLGSGEREKTKQYSSFVVFSSLFCGLLIGGLLLLGMEILLPLLGTNESTAPYAKAYLQILALGTPFSILGGALGNTARADGDSRSAVLATLLGTVLNILLDPVFISVLGMGARGAAIATVLGNVVSCLFILCIASRKEVLSLSPKDFTLRPDVSLHVLSLGVPMAAGTLLMSFSHIFFNRLLVAYGNDAVAAHSVAGKISMLIPMIIMGICMGIQPAVSYAYGAKSKPRLRQIIMGTGLAVILFGIVTASVVILLRDKLVTAFLPDPAVLQLGKRMVLASVIAVPVYGVYQLCSTCLQAIGKVPAATFTSLLRQGIVYIPVVYLLNVLFQLDGLIYASAVTDVIAASVALILCLYQARKTDFPLAHIEPIKTIHECG